MIKLSFLLLALFVSQNVKADPANRLNQLAHQIDIASHNLEKADGKTDVKAELESMISLQRDYERTSCNYLKQIRNQLTSDPSEMHPTLKQIAKKHLCGSKVSMETSNAFEVQYAESNISSDILNFDQKASIVSWVRVFRDGSSKVSNF